MNLKNKFHKIIEYEKTIFWILPLLFLLLYIFSIDVKYSVAADATGKWQQTRDILTKPLFDFTCSYKYDFDPGFQYIPGPGYFYFLDKGQCFHMYSYAFAYLLAPFLYLFSDFGIYILNYLSWLIYIYSFASITKLAVKNNKNSYLYGGLFAIFVSPAVIYAIGFTEVTLSFALGAYSLSIIYTTLKSENNFPKLFFAGLILGLIVSMRTESIIYTVSLYFSTFLFCVVRKDNFHSILQLFFPLVIGLILGLALVGISHQILFDNIAGFRGSNAVRVMKSGFSIKNQLEIAYLQLFAGNRGLFTSMPIVVISFFYLHPAIRSKFKGDGLFFFLIALMTVVIIVATTPWGDFADWTPRYLSLAFAPFLISVLQICLSDKSKFLEKKFFKIVFIILLTYSIVFNLVGIVLTSKITNMVKVINLKIEEFKADSIVLDTLIPYIYISQHNVDKPIFSLRLDEKQSEEIGKMKLVELIKTLDEKRNNHKILIIQIEGISRFLFRGDEVSGWKKKDSFTIMKKVKFLLIEK